MVTLYMVIKHSLDCLLLTFNMMRVFLFFYSSLESIALVNQILPHLIQWPNQDDDNNPLILANDDEFDKLNDKSWSSITVNEDLFNEMRDEMVLNDYPHIQFILIQKESFRRISNLTISKLPELKTIIIEDNSFYNTISLTLLSIFYFIIIMNRSSKTNYIFN